VTSTNDILDRLVVLCSALKWPSAPTAAFSKVLKFDSADRNAAYGQILFNEARTCLVVLNKVRWESEISGRNIFCRRYVDISVVVSDCILGARQQALFGKAGTNPGALTLSSMVINALTGPLLGDDTNDVAIMPTQENVADLEADSPNLPGRVCVFIDFTCRGGQDSAPLNASFNS
jgi:hypothetical protein